MTRRLALKKVALASSLVHDLPRSGDAEGLLCATVRFHLWHVRVPLVRARTEILTGLLVPLPQHLPSLYARPSALPLLRSFASLGLRPWSYSDLLA